MDRNFPEEEIQTSSNIKIKKSTPRGMNLIDFCLMTTLFTFDVLHGNFNLLILPLE